MKYQAKAIGSGSEGAQTELQKEYHKVRNQLSNKPCIYIYTNLVIISP